MVVTAVVERVENASSLLVGGGGRWPVMVDRPMTFVVAAGRGTTTPLTLYV